MLLTSWNITLGGENARPKLTEAKVREVCLKTCLGFWLKPQIEEALGDALKLFWTKA